MTAAASDDDMKRIACRIKGILFLIGREDLKSPFLPKVGIILERMVSCCAAFIITASVEEVSAIMEAQNTRKHTERNNAVLLETWSAADLAGLFHLFLL